LRIAIRDRFELRIVEKGANVTRRQTKRIESAVNEFNVEKAIETVETSSCAATYGDVFFAPLFFFSDLSLRPFHLLSFCFCCSFLFHFSVAFSFLISVFDFHFTIHPISYAIFLSALIMVKDAYLNVADPVASHPALSSSFAHRNRHRVTG
jgi:hypothetical protein